MPADYFAALINNTHAQAEQEREKFEKNRDAEVDMYRQVALDPNSSPEQRQAAGKKMDQLLNIKSQGGIWQKLTDHLNTIKGTISQAQPGQQGGQPNLPNLPGAPEYKAAPGTGEGSGTLGFPEAQPQPTAAAQPQTPPANQTSPLKQGFAQRTIQKIGKGLGAGMQAVGDVLAPRPPSLPPLDTSIMGGMSPEQQMNQKADIMIKERQRLMDQGWSMEEADAFLGLKMPSQGRNYLRPGPEVLGSKLPPNAMGPNGQLTDAQGKLMPGVDPKELYQPMIASIPGIPAMYYPKSQRNQFITIGNREYQVDPFTGDYFDENGQVAGNIYGMVKNLGTTTTSQRPGVTATGQPVLYTVTGGRTPVTGGLPGAPEAPGGTPPATSQPQAAPPPAGAGGGAKGGASQPRAQTLPGAPKEKLPPGTKSMGDVFTPGQFNTMQKGAMGVQENYSSLVGDDPKNPGGLYASMKIFDNKKDVDSLSDYFTSMHQYMEQQARLQNDSPLDYIIGLPNYLSTLKSEALADKYNKLSPEAQQFADAYTRAVGTAAGLRSVTSASTAMASIARIDQEFPNPQFVKNRAAATRRLKNVVDEIYDASTYNPLLRDYFKGRFRPTFPGEGGSQSPGLKKMYKKYNIPEPTATHAPNLP